MWFIGNILYNGLMSTNAFEVYANGELVRRHGVAGAEGWQGAGGQGQRLGYCPGIRGRGVAAVQAVRGRGMATGQGNRDATVWGARVQKCCNGPTQHLK